MSEGRVPRYWWWVGAITAAGFGFRLAMLVLVHWGTEPGFNDAPYYSDQAIQLTQGDLFRDPAFGGPGAEHGPLTPVLFAPFSWGGSPFDTQRVGALLIGTVAIVLLGLAARGIAGDRAGIVATAVAAAYPNLWMNDGLVMSEGPATLMVALWMLAGLRWRAVRGWRAAALWGVAGGLAALTRSELALLVLASLVIVLLAGGAERVRTGAIVAGLAAATVAPWVGWNLVRFERPVTMTTNDGTTIRGANCDDTYFGPNTGSWSISCLITDGGQTVGFETSVRAQEWRGQGFDYARDHADRLPVVVAARAGRLLDLYDLDHQVDEDQRDHRPRWASWLGIVAWWLLAPLTALGIRRAPRDVRALLVAPVVIALVTGVLFYGGHRIRSPAEPAVVVAAAVALAGLARRRRSSEEDDDEPVSAPAPVLPRP